MTKEQLLGLSADDWEKLSEEELKKWSEQFYHVTRPSVEKAKEAATATVKSQQHKVKHTISDVHSNAQKALELASKLGIKI